MHKPSRPATMQHFTLCDRYPHSIMVLARVKIPLGGNRKAGSLFDTLHLTPHSLKCGLCCCESLSRASLLDQGHSFESSTSMFAFFDSTLP